MLLWALEADVPAALRAELPSEGLCSGSGSGSESGSEELCGTLHKFDLRVITCVCPGARHGMGGTVILTEHGSNGSRITV